MRRYVLLFVPFLAAWNPLDRPNRAVEEGNTQMSAGKADAALVEYDKAVAAMPNEPAAHFNRGTALHALSRYDEAITEFMRATEAREPGLKATAFYNLGNSYFQANRYVDAIAAYKRSLALNPSDVRAKWNLELALQKKKEEEKKKQEDQKNKQDENKDDKKDDKQDQNKDDKKDDQDKQKQDGGTPPKPQAPQDAGAQPPQPEPQPSAQPQDDKASDMNEVDAVLDNLERSPKDLEKMRARLRAVRRAPPAKDW